MIKISNLTVPLNYDLTLLVKIAASELGIEESRIISLGIEKRKVVNKNKEDIHFDMTIAVSVSDGEDELAALKEDKRVSKEMNFGYSTKAGKKLKSRPVVVGCGPAGLFAALILAQAGERPIILERGQDVESRRKSVGDFWVTGKLDTSSNVQFGEGGAGTFSDGKLNVGNKDFRKRKILHELTKAGALPEILYVDKPHIGTDRLHEIVKNIRQSIIALGGEVNFNAKVTAILQKDGQVTGVGFEQTGEYRELNTDHVVLAIGHSARDTLEKLFFCGIRLEQKPFAIGVRVEHPQERINKLVYGDYAGHPALGAADYRMVVHLPNTRGVYTFCMCPGGSVVAAASEENLLVTNGMSLSARDGKNANSALLVTIQKEDLCSEHPLAGIALQRNLENAAFIAGGGGYKAPVQRVEDFLRHHKTSSFGEVLPTYLPGTSFAEMDSFLPEYLTDSLRQGIHEMDHWMNGFAYPDALLTGIESRSSSPVRITRDEHFESVSLRGLFPCGEGAGYAGGILSAALDGVLCAEKILQIG